jgi:ATP-binding cassette subfamily F protein 3
MLTSQRNHEKQLDKIRAEEQYIMRYKAGQRAKQARGRATRLERFKQDELVDRPMELEVMQLELPKAPRVGDHVLRCEGLAKRYGEKVLFDGLELAIKPMDRIGIVGPNGAGKTTLVRALLGDLAPDAGEVKVSPQMKVGYFRQTQEHIDPMLTIWQYLQRVIASNEGALRASEQQARNLAGAFLFSGEEQEKCVGNLSGGERGRMVIAGLVSAANNLIILDETPPDEGGYDGALLLISHDRALLASCCDRLVILDGNGGARLFDGNWDEWEEKEAEEKSQRDAATKAANERAKAKAEAAKQTSAAAAAPKQKAKPAPAGDPKLARMETDRIERRITEIETRIRAIDDSMMDPKVYSDSQKSRQLTQERERLQQELEPLEFEWARRAE